MSETSVMDLSARPVAVAGKVVEVATLPSCNVCTLRTRKSVSARFDAYVPTVRSWAYVCPSCYLSEGCRIGLGAGQILFVASESVRSVRRDIPEMPGIGLLVVSA